MNNNNPGLRNDYNQTVQMIFYFCIVKDGLNNTPLSILPNPHAIIFRMNADDYLYLNCYSLQADANIIQFQINKLRKNYQLIFIYKFIYYVYIAGM